MNAPKFRVNWDNGRSGCGTFPYTFDTEQEAQAFADDWAAESNARDGCDPDSDDCYSAEVIQVEE